MSYRWVVLGIAYLAMLSYAFVFQVIPPVLSLIIADLDLSHAQVGLLMSLFALPGVFLSIPIGVLADRYGPRNLIVLCFASMIVGSTLVVVGRSFPVLALGRLIAGAGGMSIFIVAAHYVAQWFAGRELGMAVGIYSTTMPIATITSLNTLGVIGVARGWQMAVYIGMALTIVALIVFVILYRPAQSDRELQPLPSLIRPAAAIGLGWPIWMVGLIWMFFNAAVISFSTFAPDFFVSAGFSIGYAGFLSSFVMLLSPVLGPVIGFLLDRIGRQELFIALSGLLIAAVMHLIPLPGLPLIPLLIVLSIGTALTPTPVFSLPPRLLEPRLVGTGYGIVSTCLNLGTLFGPYVAGVARDLTGTYDLSFYLMSAFAVLTTILALGLFAMRTWVRGRELI